MFDYRALLEIQLSVDFLRVVQFLFLCVHVQISLGQWDCQMTLWIGRGFAEVQILKKSESGPVSWTFWYILIQFCIPITIDMI